MPLSRKLGLILALAAGMTLVLVSCRGLWPGTGESPLPGTGEPKVQASEPKTFAILYPMSHPYFEWITESTEAAAKEMGVKLLVKAPDEAHLEQQIRMLEMMIKQKVDGIAIDPVDAETLTPYIDKAVEAGIPVVCFDSDAPVSRRLAFIGSDNTQAGRQMGAVIDKMLKGRGMIFIGTGMESMLSQQQRLRGLLDYLHEDTGIQVLEIRANEGSEDLAVAQLEEMIEAHPHFDAFIGLDSVSGPASILVWKAMGLHRTAATFDLTPKIIEGIKNGQVSAALSRQEHTWGRLIVKRLLQASQGLAIPEFEETGTVVVTPENVRDTDGWR
ncbi:sugar ABC transporter substrate-binding protein [Paenibacillus mucilaginosus]|uniref:Periplasmic binding protein/LacI transcriptional regulator n=1 Tax=Paenibacillus mucilaginosus (strain KNP414) TaxID=1036673 RepID=F8F8R7_PAEMK|nr:substrate-binding domain-containing protein [Paenibacillus mucilaginosus]AEI41979.1 periplasmic binding protein/LacI transcriptional regulator [Paenibacillus mucilaginosus KNP414]MCG7217837.1 substrate-binding domain-containing protein [Paenibacillus mucilaginosus]WDM28883.1 substrate-binding domain-containing protein [Paenibacillus mucilaginosus]